MIVKVDFDLVLGLCMSDGEAIPYLDFLAIFAADAEKGADDSVLVDIAPGGVVEDREDGLY